MRTPVVLFGAGGHARVVLEILQMDQRFSVVGIIDPDPALAGTSVLGVPVLGGDDQIARCSANSFFVGIGGAGDASTRRRVFEEACALGLSPVVAIHPAATVSASAHVGLGTAVMARAVVNPGARLGRNVIVNTGAIIDHDCDIGDHAHIAPGAALAGQVQVGESALVGVGAAVRQGIRIGRGAIVGAGAAVVRDVAEQQTVVGVPARVMRR